MTDSSLLRDARERDQRHPLRSFRDRFHLPRREDDTPLVYLCGNSLGLQPRGVRERLDAELDLWARRAVNGHFEGDMPWYHYHTFFQDSLARIVGAHPDEVVAMGALTANLHLLMASFYRPTTTRYRILMEGGAFPSDRYAMHSQAAHHGHDPDDAVLELRPRDGEETLRTEDILDTIAREGERLALVMLGGIHYYTGQLHDLRAITRAAHDVGALAGFDLAHAAGNAPLRLHDDSADFAVWCSYKYLNSGPGGTAGVFVHRRHGDNPDVPRLAGWWGNDPEARFRMPERFTPQRGAAGWQLSNAPVLPMAALRASLDLFDEATMPALRQRSMDMASWLLDALDDAVGDRVDIITPRDPNARGAQTSLRFRGDARRVQEELEARGVVGDFRPPDVVRIAPTPLYNTWEDMARFVELLHDALD
ncbi:MAG: kynureninase [Deltaproteobacteria bacterium]|nr:MAG: kynureninase [Deltaproteobacteria bacterium]